MFCKVVVAVGRVLIACCVLAWLQSVLGDRTTSVNHADAHVLKKTFPRTFESPIVSFATSDAVPRQARIRDLLS